MKLNSIDEKSLVPMRWLTIVVGSALSCFGASLYLVFSIGSVTTSLTLGHENLVDRVSAIEADRAVMLRNYNDHEEQILQRLTALETQNKVILDLLRVRK